MILRLFRPCFLSALIYPDALFRVNSSEKTLCLTFDDGPDPHSTPEVLDILYKHSISAVFFCNGSAAKQYPSLIEQIKSKGHMIGNHGFNHADGWKTKTDKYCKEVESASAFTSGTLFRPPYGRLKPAQYKKLVRSFRIILWDLMAYDFDVNYGAGRSLDLMNRKIRNGSIIVLHDTHTSTCLSFLADFLEKSTIRGYRFILP